MQEAWCFFWDPHTHRHAHAFWLVLAHSLSAHRLPLFLRQLITPINISLQILAASQRVLAKCYGGQSRGVLTGEEKRVILRDAGGGKTQIWPLGKRHIYSGFTFVIHEVQSRRGVDRNAKHEMSLRSKSSHRTW